MKFIKSISSLFSLEKNNTHKNLEIEKVFSVLKELTTESGVRDDFSYRLETISSHGNKNEAYVKLYLDWENYLINRHSIEKAGELTADSLRRKIRDSVNKDVLEREIYVIFGTDKERFAYLAESFLNEIAGYVSSNLGDQALVDIYKVIIKDNETSSVLIKEGSFDFEEFNRAFLSDPSYSEEKLISIFRVLFEVLSERIEVSFGAAITKKLFNDVFSKLQNFYSTEFVSDVIKIIPERVLSLDEWLSKLSKGELEARVKEKTTELEGLTSDLEKKVNDRTEELRKAYEELKKLDQKKSEFIYLIAHQMRTPLVSIKWGLSMLKDGDAGKISEDQKKIVTDAYNANERMNKTINEILLADDIMGGELKFEKSPFDVILVLKKVIEELEEVAKITSIKIEFKDIPESKLVLGDKDKIKMAFLSVVDNAIRYSPPDGVVTVSSKVSEGGLFAIEIKDRGIGIPKESFSRVGERFYRADNALKQNTYGTGLGLFIVKNVVEGSGGVFKMESDEGQGTKVSIILKESKN
ncbi:MAG: hypothetical protein QG585_276 [Patescibacteria group bacterium]|nr:hypothetical protein [Patescibacteria group bacterium]